MLNALVLNKFRKIIEFSFQCGTKFIQSLGFHIIICPEPADGFAVDAAFFPKLIGAHTLFRHGFPELIKYNHIITSILDTDYYGGYNLGY